MSSLKVSKILQQAKKNISGCKFEIDELRAQTEDSPSRPPISKTHKIICCCAVISVLVNVICVLMDGGVIVSQISRLSIFAWSTHDSRARGFTSLATSIPSLSALSGVWIVDGEVSSGYSLLEIQKNPKLDNNQLKVSPKWELQIPPAFTNRSKEGEGVEHIIAVFSLGETLLQM